MRSSGAEFRKLSRLTVRQDDVQVPKVEGDGYACGKESPEDDGQFFIVTPKRISTDEKEA